MFIFFTIRGCQLLQKAAPLYDGLLVGTRTEAAYGFSHFMRDQAGYGKPVILLAATRFRLPQAQEKSANVIGEMDRSRLERIAETPNRMIRRVLREELAATLRGLDGPQLA
jgi:hypothetical protein